MMRLVAEVLVVLMLIALFVGGAQPQAVGLVPVPWDKLAHATFFLVFALLLARFVSLLNCVGDYSGPRFSNNKLKW